jgi:hypothetical protein
MSSMVDVTMLLFISWPKAFYLNCCVVRHIVMMQNLLVKPNMVIKVPRLRWFTVLWKYICNGFPLISESSESFNRFL